MLTTDRSGRRGRGGVLWWCVLPDVDTATPVARLLTTEANSFVAHVSGRPWLLGRDISTRLRTVSIGQTRVAVIGTCLTTDAGFRGHVEIAVRSESYDALAALPGSYHLCVSGPAGVLVFGDVAGFRRVFITQAGAITVAASHADVLRRLVDAPVNRTWLAARLASPEMPNPLRESLSPFEGVHAIPAGHRVTLGRGSARHSPYWTPPRPTLPLSAGVHLVADALVGAITGRVGATDGPVSVQLSGGLDSTALSCLAADALPDQSVLRLVTTASVSPGNDDLHWARRVADHLAPAEHLVLDAHEIPRFFDGLPNITGGMDEPAPFTAAAARVRHLAELLAACGTRTHLNGQGGDEVLLAPLAYLRDVLRAHPRRGWRHLRGQAALRDLHLPRLLRATLTAPAYPQWLRWAAQTLRTEAPAEVAAMGWEAQPLLAQWAGTEAEQLVRVAILAAPATPVAELGMHAVLVRIRSTAYRAALYRDALATCGVSAEFPFFDRAVLEACVAVRPWERTDPWEPKPLLRAALADTIPAQLLARRTKAHYNDDIYRGWKANRHHVAELLDDSRLRQLGLTDAGVLRDCLGSFGRSGLAPAFVTDTVACEVWLRSLAPPLVQHREADDAHTPIERVPGQGRIGHPGGRRPDAAG